MKRSTLALMICSSLLCASSHASSHREAPNVTRLPTLDSTDFYAFNSYQPGRAEFVTLIANYIPLQDAYGGPNYFAMDPAAVYSIHVDNDGDAQEDLTFEFRFSQSLAGGEGIKLSVGPSDNQRQVAVPLKNVGGISAANQDNANFSESYKLSLVTGDRKSGSSITVTNATSGADSFAKPLDFIGTKSFSSRADYATYAQSFIYDISIPGCNINGRAFVGQRKDPFVVNLGKTFDLVNYVPVEGDSSASAGDGGGFPGGITQNPGNDDLQDKNVTTLALEIPKPCLTGAGSGSIGAWTTASLPQARILNPNAGFNNTEVNGGALTQVSRLGNPLVNELVIGLKDKDRFSSAEPKDDGQFLDYVSHPALPELLNILFKDAVNSTLGTSFDTLAPTHFPRNDLITAFLTGFAGVNQLATVTPSEMLRLNTAIAATPLDSQSTFGVVGDDLAGFPNGRRPGDDVVDIALRVVMGRLCYPIPINGTNTDLGLCAPEDANTGEVAFTDGAPISAADMGDSFPYLAAPLPGSE
ncbi:DUF4331 domain-containing protein [Simiduia aestuariiviva]|uniref:DUF4331 domain-containing protein n=1 Tax=Simiduia aestuariiviva TaxID=1510459 RepID=A0A839UU48_9GAMM|nr:DUF4331 domain-containing protein [Simiduia aestuariiviva]MBB3169028.1 hypothetical protein [Simiduia aestuariiviva]